jgi:hypothetical protein
MRTNEAVRLFAAVLVAGALLGASPTAPVAGAAPDPYAIFDGARKAWASGAYPHYAEYVAVVRFRNGSRTVKRTWETTEDLRQGIIYSGAFSREETANPSTPHGINIGILGFGASNAPQPVDPIGHVAFAIDQDYGLAFGTRRLTSVTSTAAIDAQRSALPVIGRTGTVARDYEVRLIETAVDALGPEYHLALTPLHDRTRYRLRELWVDGKTSLPEEAVVDGIGNRPPLTKVQWLIEYRQTQGGTYIARESALAPLDCGAAGTLEGVTVTFDEVHLTARRSPYRFGFSKDVPQGEP